MIAAEPLEAGCVEAVSADSAPACGGVELDGSVGVHLDVDATAASDDPGFVGRKRAGKFDGAVYIFEIERAADAADARVAADKADRDFAGDGVGRELATDFADLEAARQVRGADLAANDAGFDVRGVLDFEMSTDHARDERRAQAEQSRSAGNFFDRYFALDGAAIEFTGDVAESDRGGGFD